MSRNLPAPDDTRIIGLSEPLAEKERLASVFADNISPLGSHRLPCCFRVIFSGLPNATPLQTPPDSGKRRRIHRAAYYPGLRDRSHPAEGNSVPHFLQLADKKGPLTVRKGENRG